MLTLDTSTPFGARANERLWAEQVGWLTTVSAIGKPVPSPVWFLWNGESMLIYSQPGKPKVMNIESNDQVSFNLNSDEQGEDVVILEGTAALDPDAPSALNYPAYLEKYHAGILSIQMTDESFSDEFSVAIRMTPQRIRGH